MAGHSVEARGKGKQSEMDLNCAPEKRDRMVSRDLLRTEMRVFFFIFFLVLFFFPLILIVGGYFTIL